MNVDTGVLSEIEGRITEGNRELQRISNALIRIADALEMQQAMSGAAVRERHARLKSRYEQAAARFETGERREWRGTRPSDEWVRRHREDEETAATAWDELQALESAHPELSDTGGA